MILSMIIAVVLGTAAFFLAIGGKPAGQKTAFIVTGIFWLYALIAAVIVIGNLGS